MGFTHPGSRSPKETLKSRRPGLNAPSSVAVAVVCPCGLHASAGSWFWPPWMGQLGRRRQQQQAGGRSEACHAQVTRTKAAHLCARSQGRRHRIWASATVHTAGLLAGDAHRRRCGSRNSPGNAACGFRGLQLARYNWRHSPALGCSARHALRLSRLWVRPTSGYWPSRNPARGCISRPPASGGCTPFSRNMLTSTYPHGTRLRPAEIQ